MWLWASVCIKLRYKEISTPFTIWACRPDELRVMLSAHWFLFSSPLRFFLWPSLHLHQPLLSSETSCRSDGCWAGSIRKSNLGRLAHASRHTDTQTHHRYLLTNAHTVPLVHSGPPASSLIDLHLLYQMDSSPLPSSSSSSLSVWLRIINVPDRVRRVCKQFFI